MSYDVIIYLVGGNTIELPRISAEDKESLRNITPPAPAQTNSVYGPSMFCTIKARDFGEYTFARGGIAALEVREAAPR